MVLTIIWFPDKFQWSGFTNHAIHAAVGQYAQESVSGLYVSETKSPGMDRR